MRERERGVWRFAKKREKPAGATATVRDAWNERREDNEKRKEESGKEMRDLKEARLVWRFAKERERRIVSERRSTRALERAERV